MSRSAQTYSRTPVKTFHLLRKEGRYKTCVLLHLLRGESLDDAIVTVKQNLYGWSYTDNTRESSYTLSHL